MIDRNALKYRANQLLSQRRWLCIGVCFLYGFVIAAVSGASIGILALFIIPVMQVGLSTFTLRIWRNQPADAETVFAGFRSFLRNVGAILLSNLLIFLWSLLFLIPGIMEFYALRFVPYILADTPDISAENALQLSRAMTRGKRWDLFLLDLSYIGWNLLSALTFGLVGVFYVTPFYEITMAGAYETLSEAYYASPTSV